MSMLVLLYEFPAETRLTVYRRLDIRVQLQLVGSQKNVEQMIIFFNISGFSENLISFGNINRVHLYEGSSELKNGHCRFLLYEFPAETRLTVYRRLDIPKP